MGDDGVFVDQFCLYGCCGECCIVDVYGVIDFGFEFFDFSDCVVGDEMGVLVDCGGS